RAAPPRSRGTLTRLPSAAGSGRLHPRARPLSGTAGLMGGSSAERKVRRAARAALDKKAVDLTVLDVQLVSTVTDYFLVCSGRSAPHVKTIAEAIRDELKTDGVRPLHAEGQAESGWVLLDYGDVLMHVFLEDTRAYYALERLWGDAPLLSVSSAEDGAWRRLGWTTVREVRTTSTFLNGGQKWINVDKQTRSCLAPRRARVLAYDNSRRARRAVLCGVFRRRS